MKSMLLVCLYFIKKLFISIVQTSITSYFVLTQRKLYINCNNFISFFKYLYLKLYEYNFVTVPDFIWAYQKKYRRIEEK